MRQWQKWGEGGGNRGRAQIIISVSGTQQNSPQTGPVAQAEKNAIHQWQTTPPRRATENAQISDDARETGAEKKVINHIADDLEEHVQRHRKPKEGEAAFDLPTG